MESSSNKTATSALLSPNKSFLRFSYCLTRIAVFTLSKLNKKYDLFCALVFFLIYSPTVGAIFYTTGFITYIYTVADVIGGKPIKTIGT